MASQDLAVLRTSKIAMDEGLITQEDFDQVKVAFLKAQQIKAGLDAGFIREEDYVQARDSFLHSLDFRVASHHQHPVPAPQPAAPIPVAAAPAPAPARTSSMSAPRQVAATPPISLPAPAPAPVATYAPVPSTSSGGAAPAPAAPVSPKAPQPQVALAGAFLAPTDLPWIGRAPDLAGKKSMSGITLSTDVINVFNHMRTKRAFKWAIFKVNDAGLQVVTDLVGPPDSSYENFANALPTNQCRYAVYDYAYSNADTQQTINKLVFLHWAPDSSTTKSKMMYASTKDFLKGYLEGIGAELQATDHSELSENEMRDRVHQALTRK